MYKITNTKKNKHNKTIIIVTIVLVLFSVFTLILGRSASSIETIFKDTIANIEYYVIKAPIQYVSGLLSEYNELKNVYEENERLKEKLDNYARETALNEVLDSEMKELKEQTAIDYLPTDYNVKYASVVARDAESWSNQITIDLGTMSGIKEGMAVITSKGMIGTVTDVSSISSNVSLLSSENAKSQLPVMILSGDEEYYGLLNRYDLRSESYVITLLSDAEKIEKNAKVVTSGLGGIGKSPKGILIGTVDEFTVDNNSTETTCIVKPTVDFNKMNFVAVVQRVNE